MLLTIGDIEPGKRPLSSSVPVIVENSNIVELIAGGSGGTKIITEVILVLLNALENNMRLDEAIDCPRIHHQLFPNTVFFNNESLIFPSVDVGSGV